MEINFAQEIATLKDECKELTTKISSHQMATIEDINEMLSTLESLNTNLSTLSLDAKDIDKDPTDMNSKWVFQKLIVNWWKNFNVFIVEKLSIPFIKESGWLCNKINVRVTDLIITLDDDCIADLRKSVNYKELDENSKSQYSNSCFINDALKASKDLEDMIHHDLDEATFDKESTKIYRSEFEVNKAIMRCKEIRLHLLSKVKKDKDEQAVLKEIAEKKAASKNNAGAATTTTSASSTTSSDTSTTSESKPEQK